MEYSHEIFFGNGGFGGFFRNLFTVFSYYFKRKERRISFEKKTLNKIYRYSVGGCDRGRISHSGLPKNKTQKKIVVQKFYFFGVLSYYKCKQKRVANLLIIP